MAEFFLELLSEEIPARMQRQAAADLRRLVTEALAPLRPEGFDAWFGPRRLALSGNVHSHTEALVTVERGPRRNAPEQALAGFLRKHGAAREALREEGDFWVLDKTAPSRSAAELLQAELPSLLWRFPWPKSMRWGGTSAFTWVRPLRRIACLLGGEVVRFALARGEDDGHGLVSGNVTEGHRFMAPGEVAVSGTPDWLEVTASRSVIADNGQRQCVVYDGLTKLAAEKGLVLVEDAALLDEVAGLVEWPVSLLGRIDESFMDLPAEVMQVSMRVNQRYFALRHPDGSAAPYFGFVANIEATDGGAAIIAGNERVLRARFADARYFWDLDRRTRLEDRLPALNNVTFHAKLGSQGQRASRIAALAEVVARSLGADRGLAKRAGLLVKADLTTGMVGEFPELQGVMGSYYASHDGEPDEVVTAIREHYAPRGPHDAIPTRLVAAAVAIADKVDQIASFFFIGEAPTGSGDPFALRRAALGIIRTLRAFESGRLDLRDTFERAIALLGDQALISTVSDADPTAESLSKAFDVQSILSFIYERLAVQYKSENGRTDVLRAALGSRLFPGASHKADVVWLLGLTDALTTFLKSADGAALCETFARSANILRIEERKDAPDPGYTDPTLFVQPEERNLMSALTSLPGIDILLTQGRFREALEPLAALRAPLDNFFATVTVNADDPVLRRNRLRLLRAVRDAINPVADFTLIQT